MTKRQKAILKIVNLGANKAKIIYEESKNSLKRLNNQRTFTKQDKIDKDNFEIYVKVYEDMRD